MLQYSRPTPPPHALGMEKCGECMPWVVQDSPPLLLPIHTSCRKSFHFYSEKKVNIKYATHHYPKLCTKYSNILLI